jgi:hypothetical protein
MLKASENAAKVVAEPRLQQIITDLNGVNMYARGLAERADEIDARLSGKHVGAGIQGTPVEAPAGLLAQLEGGLGDLRATLGSIEARLISLSQSI